LPAGSHEACTIQENTLAAGFFKNDAGRQKKGIFRYRDVFMHQLKIDYHLWFLKTRCNPLQHKWSRGRFLVIALVPIFK
jgi:hypothetical protein